MIWTCVDRSNFIKIHCVYFSKFLKETQEDVCMREEREDAVVEEGFSEGIKFLGCWFLSSCQLKFINLVTIKDLSSYTFYLKLATVKHEEGGEEEELKEWIANVSDDHSMRMQYNALCMDAYWRECKGDDHDMQCMTLDNEVPPSLLASICIPGWLRNFSHHLRRTDTCMNAICHNQVPFHQV